MPNPTRPPLSRRVDPDKYPYNLLPVIEFERDTDDTTPAAPRSPAVMLRRAEPLGALACAGMALGRVWIAALSCVAALGFTGCGGGGDSGGAAGGPISPASSTSSPPKLPGSAGSSGGAGEAACKLKGSSGGAAKLVQDGDGLTMTFTGLPVKSSGTVLYSVTAYDATGEQGGQLGVKYQDGKQVAFFVFDFGAGSQTNLDGDSEDTGNGVTASIADDDLGPLSGVKVAQWSAAYAVNGDDVGVCPGGIDSLPFPG